MNGRAKQVRLAIRRSGLARERIASDSGLSADAVASWLAGRRDPTEPSIAKLAAGLRKRAAVLVTLADQLERGG